MAQGDYGVVTSVKTVRDILVTVGLGTPTRRAAAVLGISLGLAYVARKPIGAFTEDGSMRPFKPIAPEHPDATYTHFLVVPVALAAATFALS
jgi:hypothetical protein